jgi:hypothetical protein
MFRSATARVAARMSDLIDDMLVGDFDYIVDGEDVYADIDYDRLSRECGARVRPAISFVDRDRRPGMVDAQPTVCTSPMWALTVAASRRSDAA